VLVFSVAFGLSSDFTIYFLSKYKLEVLRHNWNVSDSIKATLRETGISMIYTALILFFGFGTFMSSDFEGTKYMGLLVSVTLASSLFSNMLFLPALLLTFDKIPKRTLRLKRRKKEAEDQ
jgi:predicted RND superfamily exporter protein